MMKVQQNLSFAKKGKLEKKTNLYKINENNTSLEFKEEIINETEITIKLCTKRKL